jgi:hypothetical protein
MKHILRKQAKRAAIVLAAAAAISALGIGTAQAAPQFTSTTITLDRFGNLECNFRETGLTPGAFVRYDCSSQYVGVMEQCMLKNRPVGNSQLYIFNNIHPEEVENKLVRKNGTIFDTILTNIPEPGEGGQVLICTAPSELTVTAIRWCNDTLTDLTNNIVGGTVAELFATLVTNSSGSVPSCAVLANGPFTTPGE